MSLRHAGRSSSGRGLRDGFTLLEMMIAMAIVAIIVGLAASGIRAMTRSGAQSEVQRVLVVAIQAQDRHAAEHNVYAASAEALAGYGLDAHAGVQLTVQSASREDYCMEAVLASGAGATYSARPGEVVLEADCANRLIDAGGNVDGEPDPILATTPTAFDLGRVIVGTTATGVVTIRNDGGGWLTGSASISEPFVIDGDNEYLLTAAETDTVTITFSPTVIGTVERSLNLTRTGRTGRTGSTVAVRAQAYIPPEIDVSPGGLDFGDAEIGTDAPTRSVTVTNTGGSILTGSVTVDDAQVQVIEGESYSLVGGASSTVRFRFTPSAPAGTLNATATFSGADGATVSLTGSKHLPPDIEVSPGSHDYGSVLVGETASHTFTARNVGGGTLTGNATVNAPFEVASGASYSLSAGETQQVQIRFVPTADGPSARGAMFAGGGGQSVNLRGFGYVPPHAGVEPAALDFGSVELGESRDAALTITNTGGSTLTGQLTTTAPFTVLGSGEYDLPGGESASFTVRFAPTAEGTVNRQVALSDSAAGVQAVPVTGAGHRSPALSVTPSSLAFPDTMTGDTSTRSVTVTNSGGGVLEGGAAKTGPFAVASGGSYSLPAGASQTVAVRFGPTASGAASGSLTLTGGGGETVALSGRGFLPPEIAVTPVDRHFGDLEIGQSSTRTFTVSNAGEGTLSGSVSVPAPWTVASGGSYSLGAGESFVVTLRFAPTASQAYSGNATFSGGGGATAAIAGQGHNPPELGVSPTSLTFPATAIGSTSTRSVTVTNTGEGTLSGGASVSGPFAVVSGGSYNLAAGASATVQVRFEPTVSGAASGTLTLTGGGGATVTLSGQGHHPPKIEVTPTSRWFGDVEIGQSSTRTFTVSNAGEGTLSGSVSVPAPWTVASGGSYSLGAGASQTVTLRFAPTASQGYSGNATFSGGGGATGSLGGRGHHPPQIQVSPSGTVNFGDVKVGSSTMRTVTVKNVGEGTLSGSAGGLSGVFSVASGDSYSLSAGASQTVTLRFAPSAGTLYSDVAVFSGGGGANVAVSGAGFVGPVIRLSRSSYDFGSVQVGSQRGVSIYVYNDGDRRLTGRAIVNSDQYRLYSYYTDYSIAPGGYDRVYLYFDPDTVGRASATVSFSGGSGQTSMSVTGSAYEGPKIEVTPTSRDFGDVQVGSGGTRWIRIRNVGGATLSGSADQFNSRDDREWSFSSSRSFSLSAGQSYYLQVRFDPHYATRFSGRSAIRSNATNDSYVPLSFSGRGVPPPWFRVKHRWSNWWTREVGIRVTWDHIDAYANDIRLEGRVKNKSWTRKGIDTYEDWQSPEDSTFNRGWGYSFSNWEYRMCIRESYWGWSCLPWQDGEW